MTIVGVVKVVVVVLNPISDLSPCMVGHFALEGSFPLWKVDNQHNNMKDAGGTVSNIWPIKAGQDTRYMRTEFKSVLNYFVCVKL